MKLDARNSSVMGGGCSPASPEARVWPDPGKAGNSKMERQNTFPLVQCEVSKEEYEEQLLELEINAQSPK